MPMLAARFFTRTIARSRPLLTHATRSLSSGPVMIVPHYLLEYEYVGNVEEARVPFRAGHLELVKSLKDEGSLIMGGALADPIDKAYVVFSDRAAAERFVDNDPYVKNGIVTGHSIREWSVVEAADFS